MGLYGYDNNFASPLMQLPLFIYKYQGPALTFSVSYSPSMETWLFVVYTILA